MPARDDPTPSFSARFDSRAPRRHPPSRRGRGSFFSKHAREGSRGPGSTTWRPNWTPSSARMADPCPMKPRACVRRAIHGPWAPWGARSTRSSRGRKALFWTFSQSVPRYDKSLFCHPWHSKIIEKIPLIFTGEPIKMPFSRFFSRFFVPVVQMADSKCPDHNLFKIFSRFIHIFLCQLYKGPNFGRLKGHCRPRFNFTVQNRSDKNYDFYTIQVSRAFEFATHLSFPRILA